MRTILFVAVLVLALSGIVRAEEPVARFEDPVYGISLEVPDLGESRDALVLQRAAFAAPAADGFAANCNVQVQFLEMTFDAYMAMSRKQFVGADLEVISEVKSRVSDLPAATLEYAGTLGGTELRFLARVVGGEDRFWLVTCTALSSSFEGYREDFERVLDSIEIL